MTKTKPAVVLKLQGEATTGSTLASIRSKKTICSRCGDEAMPVRRKSHMFGFCELCWRRLQLKGDQS